MKITPVYADNRIDYYMVDDDFCELEYYPTFGILSGYIKNGKKEDYIGIDMNDEIDIDIAGNMYKLDTYKLNKIRYLFWGV